MIELVLAIITIALVVISLTLNIIILIKNSQKQHVNTNQDESIKEITGLISKDLDDKLSKLRIELNTSLSKEDLSKTLPNKVKRLLKDKNIKVYIIDAYKIANSLGLKNKINTLGSNRPHTVSVTYSILVFLTKPWQV